MFPTRRRACLCDDCTDVDVPGYEPWPQSLTLNSTRQPQASNFEEHHFAAVPESVVLTSIVHATRMTCTLLLKYDFQPTTYRYNMHHMGQLADNVEIRYPTSIGWVAVNPRHLCPTKKCHFLCVCRWRMRFRSHRLSI